MKPTTLIRRWAPLLLLAWMGPACADSNPPPPTDAPSPRLVPVCAETLYRACGLVDRKGNWAVEPAYRQLYANGDVWVGERESGQINLLDAGGKMISESSLRSIGRYSEGVAPAQGAHDEQYGYVDAKGQFVIQPAYELANSFSDGLAVVGNKVNGDLKMGVIDRKNQYVVPLGAYDRVDAFAYGLAVVQKGESPMNGGAVQLGLIDAHGKLVMPMAMRMGLTVIGAGRVLETNSQNHDTVDRYRLLDAQGHELFAVSGDSAVIQDPAEGLAFFTDGEGKTGLLDIQSGRAVVPARKDWSSALAFSEGRAWVALSGSGNDDVHVLIDHSGKEVLRRTGGSIGDFHGGVAAVGDEHERWGLIDRNGKLVHPMDYGSNTTPWEWSMQEPREGDVVQFTQTTTLPGSPDKTVWMDTKGTRIAALEPQACGIQAVRNAKGDVIWPKNVADTCAAKSPPDSADKAPVSDGVKAVLQEVAQRKLQQAKEEDRRNGYEFGPSSAGDILVPLGVAWQHGPATIKLDGPATFELPKGFRYLSPEAVRKLPEPVSPGGELSVALVAPEDGSWIARLVVAEQGYVPTDGVPLDTQKLEETIRYYTAGFDPRAPAGSAHMTTMDWLEKPDWDAAHHRLRWGYRFADMGSPSGGLHYDSHAELNNVTLGRNYAAAFQINLSGLSVDEQRAASGTPLETLASGIRFDAGARYEDHQPADATAALGLDGFITGPKPEETKASEEYIQQGMARAEQKRDLHILWLLAKLAIILVPVLAGWGLRRSRKAAESAGPAP